MAGPHRGRRRGRGPCLKGKGFSAASVESDEDVEGHAVKIGSFRRRGSAGRRRGPRVQDQFFAAEGKEDARGHEHRHHFTAEPAGEEDGDPVYKLDFGDEDDAEGHGWKHWYRAALGP